MEKTRRDLSPNGDTAAELRAGRYWDRTKALLDNAKEPSSTAQKLIAKASREELGTLLQELPAYLEAHGSPHEWIDTVVSQAIPEYGAARTQLTKANAALQFVQMNANSLRRGFSEGRPASVLADPFSDSLANKAKYDPDQ